MKKKHRNVVLTTERGPKLKHLLRSKINGKVEKDNEKGKSQTTPRKGEEKKRKREEPRRKSIRAVVSAGPKRKEGETEPGPESQEKKNTQKKKRG